MTSENETIRTKHDNQKQDVGDDEQEPPQAVPLACEGPIHDPKDTEEQQDETLQPHTWTSNVDTKEKVPVTLVTGFLGAGKTTLVQNLLRSPRGSKMAVLVNEIGQELGVEQDIVRERAIGTETAIQRWIELGNGCICCSVKGNFVQALEMLLETDPELQCIVVETTGMANPGPVATTLWIDDELEAGVVLDSIVTVVDAKNVLRQLDECKSEAESQIAHADVLLVNKVDLVNDVELERVKTTLRTINRKAVVYETQRSQMSIEHVLDRREYAMKDDGSFERQGTVAPHVHETTHTESVRTVGFAIAEPVQLERVREWLDHWLWEENERHPIYRMKAILHVQGTDTRYVLQAVRELYDIVQGRSWNQDETRESRVVVIGRSLDPAQLEQSFRKCIA